MKTAAARAHVNIALAKYWGKADPTRNTPAVPSLSASIRDLHTDVEVTFDESLEHDTLTIGGVPAKAGEVDRMSVFFDLLRCEAQTTARARVVSRNNFPRSAGLASSASAFAALTIAASAALGLDYGPQQLSRFARIGSGSAARSVFAGYVEIDAGEASEAGARQVATAEHLPLDVAIVISSHEEKAVSSRVAMTACADTSPYYAPWVETAYGDLNAIREALLTRDLGRLSVETERNCLKMHAVGMAAHPPILYWNATTLATMEAVWALRAQGVGVFFTIDAGPNVVVFHLLEDGEAVRANLAELEVPLRFSAVGGAPVLVETLDQL